MSEITSPAKSAVQYGVFFGVIMVLEFVILYIIGIDTITNPAIGIVINLLNFFVLPILFITLACNNFKKNINNGVISFSQCLKAGVTTAFIAALIYAIFTVIFNLIFPEFTQQMLEKTRTMMTETNPNMSQEQLDMALSWSEKFSSPFIVVPFTLAFYSFVGFIYSLIIGAILKNDRPQGY
jgi:hypothetical protein